MKIAQLIVLLFMEASSHCMEISPGVFIPPKVYKHPQEPADNSKRISNFPYISAYTFRNLAQFFVDEIRLPLNPLDIKDGDIIYLRTDLMEYFLR